MRVVYDTNVLAILLSRRDQLLRLQRAVSSDRITLVASSFILYELEVVLVEKFKLTKHGAKIRTRLLARIADIVQPTPIDKVARDPDDDMILATAITGRASYIVTLDNDLLVLKIYRGVTIVTPLDFQDLK
jgi:putative PIN family toxin of toxin-antitoxin system